ncbi:2-dehydropantoate 2-reductase [Chakrabartyella piscis]|uniref:ketopantoate reductase family protein n=1 Tax=Chakrabartyella piscis TaxID=2918914 RepID=UPI002958B976|nr:2-dehydropantoate 2-reductase [Chakrabartyella piscis]
MKIAILGAGAMGSLYGGYLSKNNEVWMVDIWQDHVNAINEKGLEIDELDGSVTKVSPKATTNPEEVGVADLAIVFVKSTQTAEALVKNRAIIGSDTIVLTLQNGYGNGEDIMEVVPKEQVIVGTTSHGCTMKGPGHIFHAGVGPTHIGAMSDDQTNAQKVADALEAVGFEMDCSDKVLALVWSKVFVNVAINAITALLDIHNGYVNDNAHAAICAELMVREAVTVANAAGMDFNADEVVANALVVAVNTSANRSSMRSDVILKRQTEITKINGAVVKKGKELGIATPYNELITQLILAKEDTYLA